MPSSASVRVISLDREGLLARLRAVTARLAAEHAEVSEVRLFGSLARGDATGISDVDVLLVLCESDEKDPIRRILRYLPFFNLDRGVDLLVYTRDELRRAVEGGNPFLRRALDESVLLFPAAGSNAG